MPPHYLREAPAPAVSFATARSRKPALVKPAPHILLFNDERYQRRNLKDGERPFRCDHVADGRLIGTLSGVIGDGVLECGHSAPFGGVDWVRRREPVGNVIALLRAAVVRAAEEGVSAIRIRARPAYFGENETVAQFALTGLGAVIERSELSLAIETGRYRSPEQYIAGLSDSARNTLRHGFDGALLFAAAVELSEWQGCYALLAETKRRRGVRLKISLEYLLELREIFGRQIGMYRLTRGGELAAAALVYRVTPDWDCLIAWGDDLAHRRHKAMNAMAYHLVADAIARRVTILDLGIASVDGVADDGLIHFKRSIGGVAGLRLDFRLPVTAAA